jgi:hypothetical protein
MIGFVDNLGLVAPDALGLVANVLSQKKKRPSLA